MNRPIRLLLLVCVALLWTTQRMPAPIDVPDDAPAATPTPKKKVKKIVRAPRKAKPVEHAEAVTTPAPIAPPPTATPKKKDDDDDDNATPTPAPAPAASATPDMAAVAARRAVVKSGDGMETVYTITASQAFDSKLTGQKIRFSVAESGTRDITDSDKKTVQQHVNFARTTSVNTGRSKTLAQLRGWLRDSFQRFLSGSLNGSMAPGQEVGRWGDASRGGELRLVEENADTLRFDYLPNTVNVLRFKRVDVEKFAELLAQ